MTLERNLEFYGLTDPGRKRSHNEDSIGSDKDIAPNLSNVAEKTDGRWLFHWLKNPRHYSPASKMPSLSCTRKRGD